MSPEFSLLSNIPDTIKYGKVYGHFISYEGNGGDLTIPLDDIPDAVPLQGTAIFTPSEDLLKYPNMPEPTTVAMKVVRAPIINGYLYQSGTTLDMVDDNIAIKGVSLVATDQPDALPDKLYYRVAINLIGVSRQPDSITIEVDSNEPIDLTQVLPVNPSPGKIPIVTTVDRERAEAAAKEAEASLSSIGNVEKELRGILDLASNTDHPIFDPELGEYTTDSLTKFLNGYKNGKVYGVTIPKSTDTVCPKIKDNADIPAPIPGTALVPAVDPYQNLGPFFYAKVNGFVDNDGWPHVTAIEGDTRFKLDGSNGDVWVMTPTIYWQYLEQSSTEATLSISDSWKQGFESQPKAYLPDGRRRPFMLYARYPLSIVDGVARSISGVFPQTRNVSHNSLITQCNNANSAYSGKSFADDWYLKVMFLVKYGNKNQSAILAGTTSYSVTAKPFIAEANTKRLVVSNSDAEKFVIGSTIIIGTGSNDRGSATSYDIGQTIILDIVDVDADSKALVLDLAEPIDVTTDLYITSYIWICGSTDNIFGDGSPISNVSNKEPAQLQGIEIFHGMYELLGDTYLQNTGDGWFPMQIMDSQLAHSSSVVNYQKLPKQIESTNNTWKYAAYPTNDNGLFYGVSYTATSYSGLADAIYINPDTTVGQRVWLSFGYLSRGALVGLWCVSGSYAFSSADWHIGSRLSGIGRAG